jgi:hypothetical protein
VAAVRLTVDEKSRTLPSPKGAKEISFEWDLEPGHVYKVRSELLDDAGNVMAGGYYVYCRRSGP